MSFIQNAFLLININVESFISEIFFRDSCRAVAKVSVEPCQEPGHRDCPAPMLVTGLFRNNAVLQTFVDFGSCIPHDEKTLSSHTFGCSDASQQDSLSPKKMMERE